jgi:hypothetical protein
MRLIMDPETQLDSLLDQAMDELNIRNRLAAHGIRNDEIVKIELSTENRIIASCNVPEGSNEVPVEGSSAPLSELRDQMKIFFNDGEKKFKLVRQIEEHKASSSSLVKVTLYIGTTRDRKVRIPKVELSFYMRTYCPCDPGGPIDDCCTT